ncbi:MAG: sigma factor-like helix-turn-helix DNA-binding protein, partial [Planctomycetota bacterium]|nr:sigma factor-like helix-turn-helix DNA-binding protein [Planctomycetota bacterium]
GAAIHSEQVERLEAAFDQMRPEWREVITLSRLVGMSMDEVADQMGRSKDATRSLLGRALVELSKLLGAD